MELHDTLVIGAGISGLTVGFHLSRKGRDTVVLEASERVGGAIQTLRKDGWIFEQGPNTVLASRPAVGRLIEEAGLQKQTLRATPSGKRRYLWKGNRLHPLPSGPGSFVTTSLFSPGAKLRLLREPWIGRPPDGTEESIAEFVRRRLGQQFLDYAVGPFVSGVYAGDPSRLSVRWAVSRIWSLEHEHGSLIRGALARRKGPQPAGGMISMQEGLDALPRRLAEAIERAGGRVLTANPCRRLRRVEGGFEAETPTGPIRARRVVLAVPADVAATLLREITGGASDPIGEIPYAPVVVASYGFHRASVRHPLDGFGFLAPRKESLRILGCLFPSSLFPARAPKQHVALAAFAGGRTDPEILDLDDEALHRTILGDLDRALGLNGGLRGGPTGEPAFRELRRWPRAIPQYEVGHGRHVELAERIEDQHPGIYLSGNWTGGISVPDCIQSATELAERVLADHPTSP